MPSGQRPAALGLSAGREGPGAALSPQALPVGEAGCYTATIHATAVRGGGGAGDEALSAGVEGNMGVAVESADAESGVVVVSAPVGSLADGPQAPDSSMSIKGAADKEWGRVAEASYARNVDLKASVTLPGNVCEYPEYYLGVTFRYPGMRIDPRSIAVTIDGADVTSEFGDIQESDESVVFRIYDALDLGVRVSGGSVLAIELKASNTWKRTRDSKVLGRGYAFISCSDDPADVKSFSEIVSGYRVACFSHGCLITVRDSTSGDPVKGAYVSVRVVECADADIVGKYIDKDGATQGRRVTLVTGSDGVVYLPGLASGTYAVTVERAPAQYSAPEESALLTVSSQLDADRLAVASLGASIEGGGGRIVSTDADGDRIEAVLGLGGKLQLPSTGLGGAGPLLAAAAGLAASALACLAALRRHGGKGAGHCEE